MSLNIPGARMPNPPLHALQGRGSMTRLVSSSKSLLTNQPSFISGTQSFYHSDHLTPLEGSLAATLLSECIHQVALLNHILPRPSGPDNKTVAIPSIVEKVFGSQLAEILSVQERLESEYDKLVEAKEKRPTSGNSALQGLFSQMGSRRSYPDQSLSMTASLTAENQKKLIEDCQWLLDTLEKVQLEISDDGHYPSLIECVKRANDEKSKIREVVQKEQESRFELKKLQATLLNINEQRKEELELCQEGIAHSKDQIQEIKNLSARDLKYIKKSCLLETAIESKAAKAEEERLTSMIEKNTTSDSKEQRIHQDIEKFLKESTDALQDKLEHWMNKFENESEEKANELREAEEKLAECLGKMQEQSKKYREYSKVVEDDRIEKEQIRLTEEREKLEAYATVRIQAWWRGTMQRNLLGPFRPKKTKKGGGKKKGGKKKKK
ncbi:IQ domain-containing protein G isoform X1 [Oopsacas minuta]|uniref:IQ domain-containing protein G isoform X1 n=1 Tax=Oopsacas minuta TaxID=111878 RepID=A0AAV7JWL5_9METZ|nr:IQ domain-containing protein G isoform X1 [Oopsacas minuta]